MHDSQTAQGKSASGLAGLQAELGYRFKDETRLNSALTHTSFVKGDAHEGHVHYERLEFLGDAVLELLASEMIYSIEPPLDEGDMTRMRAAMVCEGALAEAAKAIGVGGYLKLGRGEEHDGGREKPSILADVLEAVLGAAYLDGGWDAAKSMFGRIMPMLRSETHAPEDKRDHKTQLQELLHKLRKPPVAYRVVDCSGPDHARHFVVQAVIEGKICGEGRGQSKKAAEQLAARSALSEYSRIIVSDD